MKGSAKRAGASEVKDLTKAAVAAEAGALAGKAAAEAAAADTQMRG